MAGNEFAPVFGDQPRIEVVNIAGFGADQNADGFALIKGRLGVNRGRPKNRDHGDYATSIALQLSKLAGKPPRDIATALQKILAAEPNISKVDIAGPGFINFTLNRASQAELVNTINKAGKSYGHGNSLAGKNFNVEFISANPTGPLHLGHTRWAAVGDAIGRVLGAAGAEVTSEFYINDRGVQMDLFGESVRAAALGKPIPEDGYQGEYISDIAKELANRFIVEHE